MLEFSCAFNSESYFQRKLFSEIFPDQEIFVDDAITLEVSLWVGEPEGIIEYEPPKEKLRQNLQIGANQEWSDAFASLLDSGDFSDVTFVVSADSSKINAHKAILAARSDVFDRMFTTDMRVAKDKKLESRTWGRLP